MDMPTIDEADFQAIESMTQDQIRKRYGPWCDRFHGFVNKLGSMENLQKDRCTWRAWTRSRDAFGNFAVSPHHWYTFNLGGRLEAQFNVGMWSTHVRVGMGFEFTHRIHGNPELMQRTYSHFLRTVKAREHSFRHLIDSSGLAVEYCPLDPEVPCIVPTSEAATWLLNPPSDLAWIFLGRLLMRGEDTAELGSSHNFGKIVSSVFQELKPYWLATQRGVAGLN